MRKNQLKYGNKSPFRDKCEKCGSAIFFSVRSGRFNHKCKKISKDTKRDLGKLRSYGLK